MAQAATLIDNGSFFKTLAARIAYRSESQIAASQPALHSYLQQCLAPDLQALGFETALHANPAFAQGSGNTGAAPLLTAFRHEDDAAPTVLMYGHGDVVRGQDASWRQGQGPWVLARDGERWYGRGTADNKGQHSINLAALQTVLEARGGRLGFNVKWLFETGEEVGSPGLAEFCRGQRALLAADLLLASDGPRQSRHSPTVFLGSRGAANFELSLQLREGAHHSGNWGGLLRNPGTVLAHAIASLVDQRGCIRVPALRAPPVPDNVRRALRGLQFGGDPTDPVVDVDWGEPELSPAERVIAGNTLEVLAYTCGNPVHPVNAIPPSAQAHLHMRFVVGTDIQHLKRHLRQHLDAQGLSEVSISEPVVMAATRLDPDNPWVRFSLASIERSTGKQPVLLPNLGGSLPNDVFADILGLPTVWVPHSYGACNQHAPDEHLLEPVAREALQLMAGLFWDLGELREPFSRGMFSR